MGFKTNRDKIKNFRPKTKYRIGTKVMLPLYHPFYTILAYAPLLTVGSRHTLLDYSFGMQLGSDIQLILNRTGFAPFPAHWSFQDKLTVSVKVFFIIYHKKEI